MYDGTLMSNELELEKYKVVEWLHETESPLYWGWSINEQEDNPNLKALILRVPPYYIVNRKKYKTTAEQQYANGMNFPVSFLEKTVSFNFRLLDCLEWDQTVVNPFEQDRDNVLSFLQKAPYFFVWVDQLLSNEATLESVQEECKGVMSVMEWNTHEESILKR